MVTGAHNVGDDDLLSLPTADDELDCNHFLIEFLSKIPRARLIIDNTKGRQMKGTQMMALIK